MAKIADVVKLKTGYANFVNLKSAYDEAKENAEHGHVPADQVTSGSI